MHDLRYSCISLLLGRGVPVKVVSEIVRHAAVSILFCVGHVMPDMQNTAADGIDEALRWPQTPQIRFSRPTWVFGKSGSTHSKTVYTA